MLRCLEKACGDREENHATLEDHLSNRALQRELHLRFLVKGVGLESLEEVAHRINKSQKWKSRKRVKKIERDYQINWRIKHEAMDQDIKIARHSRAMEREAHRGM